MEKRWTKLCGICIAMYYGLGEVRDGAQLLYTGHAEVFAQGWDEARHVVDEVVT